MNLRKTLVTIVAAVALMASFAAPVALAQDDYTDNNKQNVTVALTEGGVFDAFFCDAIGDLAAASGGTIPDPGDPYNLGSQAVTSFGSSGTVEGHLEICYLDSKTSRPTFTTAISAGNFTDGSKIISSEGFKVTRTHNVFQTWWDVTCGCDVGDIGYLNSSGAKNPGGTTLLAGVDWTVANSLDESRSVQFGYAGTGTANGTVSSAPHFGSVGQVDVSLDIPAGTAAGNYTSEVTLSVTLNTP